MMKQVAPQPESGFVILFAVLIAALIFALGAGLFSTAQKETLLSSTATESQVALGATDTGAECALYYAYVNQSASFNCAGNPPGQTGVSNPNSPNSKLFAYDMRDIDPDSVACGVLSVTTGVARTVVGQPLPVSGTEIQVRGFNVCTVQTGGLVNGILSPDINDPLLIERKFRIWYQDPDPNPVAAPCGGVNQPPCTI
jgi:hypothetical protein